MSESKQSAAGETIPADIAKLSFEEALEALEQIVQRLEAGEVSLEDSIEIYTRGTQLKRHCEEKLRLAQARIEKIMSSADAAVKTAPADIE